MEPDARTPGDSSLDPAFLKKIRWAAILLVVLGIGALVFFLLRAVGEEKAAARWDQLALIREAYETEIGQDPMFEDPAGIYTTRRNTYARALEEFMPTAKAGDDALAAQVTWLLAKLYTDQFFASQDPSQAEARNRYYREAKKHWETLRDEYPDFQGNRLDFAPRGHSSVVRMVLANLEANQSWAEENFPQPKEPGTETVVVLRTERGDLRMGLYPEDAPELVETFLDRVRRGVYDGTYFFARTDEGSDADPVRRTIRGGHPDVRDVSPFDATAAVRFTEDEDAANLLPAMSRYRIAATEGVVAGWHPDADPYDGAVQLLVAVGRSPQLDHAYSPIGRLLDEPSRATAKRIFEGQTWGTFRPDDPPDDIASIRNVLRAPVRIVKALAYRDGVVMEPGATPAASKAEVTVAEEKLETLTPDAYRQEAPSPPVPPADLPDEGEDGTEAPDDGGNGGAPEAPGGSAPDGGSPDGGSPDEGSSPEGAGDDADAPPER